MIRQPYFLRIERAQLIPALLGEFPEDASRVDRPHLNIGNGDLLLAYFDAGHRAELPFAIVVQDHAIRDLFVWIDTYAPQFSPLTQNFRVFGTSELNYIHSSDNFRKDRSLARAFAGLTVGELIAQSGGDPIKALDSANLSLAQSTFSFAFGRTSVLWGGSERAIGSLFESLRALEGGGFWSSRRLGPEELMPLWGQFGGGFQLSGQGGDVWRCIGRAITQLNREESLSVDVILDMSRYFEPARELISLQSMTAEDRVLAFDRLLSAGAGHGIEGELVEAFCAAHAAVEIGGGTTRHMNLLVEIAGRLPVVWPLFGALASIGRADKWQAMFAKIGRLIERELSYSFDVSDPPRTDVSWREIIAFGSRSKRMVSVPRAQQRTMSIELLPGVPFHIPLGAALGEDRKVTTEKAIFKPDVSAKDIAKLDEALASLWALRQGLMGQAQVRESPVATVEKPKKRSTRTSRTKSDRLF